MSRKRNPNDLLKYLNEIDISHWKRSYTDHYDYKLYQCKSTGARFLAISKQKENAEERTIPVDINQSTAPKKTKPVLDKTAEAWVSLVFEHGSMTPLCPTTSTIHMPHFIEHVYTDQGRELPGLIKMGALTLSDQTLYDLPISNKDKSQISTQLKVILAQSRGIFPVVNKILNGGIGGKWIHGMKVEHAQVKCENYLAFINRWISLEMLFQFAAIPDHPVFGLNGRPIQSDYQEAVEDNLPTLKIVFQNGYRLADTTVVVGGPYKALDLKAEIAAVSKSLTLERDQFKQTESNDEDTETVVTKNVIVQETMNKIPFMQDRLHSLLIMDSVNNYCEVDIRWVIEPYYAKELFRAPLRYVLAVLDNRAKGSLCDVLMSKGYVYKYDIRADNCAFITIITLRLLLTFRGLENWEIVLKIIFQYFDWFKNESPSEIFYNQLNELQNVYFHHVMDRDDQGYGKHLATWLAYIKNPFLKITKPEKWATIYSEQPEPDIFYPVNCMQKYDEELIKKLQQLLSVEKCSVTLIYSNHFASSESLSNIKQSKKPISIDKYPCKFVALDWQALQKQLLSTTANMPVETFAIPRIPDKIMNQLTLMDCPVTPGNEWYGLKHAINNEERTLENRNVKTTTIKLGDYCHNSGSTPFATYTVSMVCNEDWIKTPSGNIFLSLWSKLLNESQQKKVCTFTTGGEEYMRPDAYEGSTIPLLPMTLNIYEGDYDISVKLEGPPRNLHTLLCDIITSVFNIDDYLSEMSWEVLESQFLLENNYEVMENRLYAHAIANYMMKTNNHLQNPTKPVRTVEFSLQDFRQKVSNFLKTSTIDLRIEGCVLESQQQEVTAFLVNRLIPFPMMNGIIAKDVTLHRRIPENRKFLVPIQSNNPNLSISCMVNRYQFTATDVTEVRKLEDILNNAIWDIQKTQCVGYNVKANFMEPEEGSDQCFLNTYYATSCSVDPPNSMELSFVDIDIKEEKFLYKCQQISPRFSVRKNLDLPKLDGKISVRVFSTVPEFKVYESGIQNNETGITYLNVPLSDKAVEAQGNKWVINKTYEIINDIETVIANW